MTSGGMKSIRSVVSMPFSAAEKPPGPPPVVDLLMIGLFALVQAAYTLAGVVKSMAVNPPSPHAAAVQVKFPPYFWVPLSCVPANVMFGSLGVIDKPG